MSSTSATFAASCTPHWSSCGATNGHTVENTALAKHFGKRLSTSSSLLLKNSRIGQCRQHQVEVRTDQTGLISRALQAARINDNSSVQCTIRLISTRYLHMRVRLVSCSNPLSLRLICVIISTCTSRAIGEILQSFLGEKNSYFSYRIFLVNRENHIWR